MRGSGPPPLTLHPKYHWDEVGLESVAYIEDPAYAFIDPSGEDLTSFLLRHTE